MKLTLVESHGSKIWINVLAITHIVALEEGGAQVWLTNQIVGGGSSFVVVDAAALDKVLKAANWA